VEESKNDVNDFLIIVNYYNPDTVKLLGSETENIEVYDLLDTFCIHCDDQASDTIKRYDLFNEILTKIDELKSSLNDKIVKKKEI
jgi:hypothetical protein